MKRIGSLVVAAVLATAAVEARAQDEAAASRPQISLMRAEEDWRALADDRLGEEPLDALKAISLGRDVMLGLGGEFRLRYESYDPLEFGFERAPATDYLLARAYLHADLRVGDGVRGFVQLRHAEASRTAVPLGPLQESDLDLQQAFVELSTPIAQGRGALRLGRQELLLGSGRMVAPRDGPNVRLSFDGGRASYVHGTRRVDAFYLRTVNPKPGAFDDKSGESYALWGAYLSSAPPPTPGLNVDLYYLGLKRPSNRFAAGTAPATRHTVGARLFGRASGWDWDLEAAYQWGKFGTSDISAYTFVNDFGYTFVRAPFRPRLGLKLDMASGDRNPADGTLNTFEVPFPKLPYLTEAALTAPANIIAVHPTLTLNPAAKLTIGAEYIALWKHRHADGYYLPPLRLAPGTAGGARFLGHFVQLSARWEPHPYVVVEATFVRAWAEGSVRNARGRDTKFGLLAATLKF
ncbi:MAG: alginate export family protein [Hyphomicrobium sp.]